MKIKSISTSKVLQYKKLSDFSVGDTVYTPDGNYAKVMNIQKNKSLPVCKITLSSGKTFKCALNHYNTVCFRTENNEKVWDTVTTQYIKENLDKYLFEFPTFETFSGDLSFTQHLMSLPCHEREPSDDITPILEKDKSKEYVISVETVSEEECWCLQLNDPSGLYYTDNGIITHNSTVTVLVNLYLAVLFAYMWAPYRYFGLAVSTQFVMALCGTSQKKASELLVEPMLNVLESTSFFQKCRTKADMIKEEQAFTDCHEIDHINWTTAVPTSVLSTSNGLNFKQIGDANGILGAAQPLDEPVKLANDCWTTMGNIKPGDKIASPVYGETTVKQVFPQGKVPCYKITLASGRTTRCSYNHQWTVAWEKDSNNDWIFKTVSTQFLIDNFNNYDFYIPDPEDLPKNFKQN